METKNQNLYFAQFIVTIFVVIIHAGTLIQNPIAHFVIKNLFCRIAVPFFFINNAYFFRLNSQNQGYTKKWLSKTLLSYTKIFLLYLPLGIHLLLQNIELDWSLFPVAMVASFVYTGSYYHLWYFPALVLSLFIVKFLVDKVGYGFTIAVTFFLFILGSVETYSSFITNPLLLSIMKKYFQVFLTTRNGIFFSPIFIVIGYYLADFKESLPKLKNHMLWGMIFAVGFGAFEGNLVYQNQGMDKNFMYFTIFFTACLFGNLLLSKNHFKRLEVLKSYSKGIFLLHLIPIEIFNIWYVENTPINGVFRVLLGTIIPVLMIRLFLTVKKYRYANYPA